jgi:hypothetical protein
MVGVVINFAQLQRSRICWRSAHTILCTVLCCTVCTDMTAFHSYHTLLRPYCKYLPLLQLSALSNQLFYSGRLSDGVTAADRAPLVQGLATLTVLDVAQGREVHTPGDRSAHVTRL